MSTRLALPDWPRMLSKRMAAAYCGLAVADFDRAIAAGQLPEGTQLAGREVWCRLALDAALDRLTGAGVPDWRKGQPLYAA